MRTEVKLAKLLTPAPTNLQRGINSNLCLCFQLHKNIFGISPLLCLILLTTVFQKRRSGIQQK